jgi:hypothetical protein
MAVLMAGIGAGIIAALQCVCGGLHSAVYTGKALVWGHSGWPSFAVCFDLFLTPVDLLCGVGLLLA